ncbi:MAG TPA: YhfC family glutamic-type intramembrane protease [Ktedonobacterales bacterium]|nr:YhfC family glutamic-type intramembrane protease [Ktedonobacterales bacterium]
MTLSTQPGSLWWGASFAALALYILVPLALIIIAHSRLKVGWRYAGYGALIFFLFQIITRLPAIQVAQYFLTPRLKSSQAALYAFLFVASLTAGLFEEVGRYVGYRWLMGREEKTWAKAVMYGLGHGGLESAVLIGGLAAITLVNVYLIVSTNGAIVPAAQRAQAAQQIAGIASQPAWLPLLGVWERVSAITMQVAFSVIVLQVFRRGSLAWLWLAIGLHTLVDFAATVLAQVLPISGVARSVAVEGILTVVALGALWLIFALRDRPATPVQAPLPGEPKTDPVAE